MYGDDAELHPHGEIVHLPDYWGEDDDEGADAERGFKQDKDKPVKKDGFDLRPQHRLPPERSFHYLQ